MPPSAPGPLTPHRLLPVGGVVVGMSALATLSALSRLIGGGAFPLRAVAVNLAWLVCWLALTPVILWLAARFPLRRDVAAPGLLVHVLGASACAWLYAEYMAWLQQHWLEGLFAPGENPLGLRAQRYQFGLFSYGLILSLAYLLEFLTRLREREVAGARLEGELAHARLRVLKAQLQPHFLFNTLHAVTVLIRRDPDAAARMLTRLSDLLRLALADGDRQEAPLEQELRFLRLYLEIEQMRFRDRLRVAWDVEPGLEAAAVPALVLQPLVENALKHGIGARADGGTVVIAASRDGDRLRLVVSDDGPGLGAPSTPRAGAGIGLRSTRGRLQALYGPAYRLTVEPRPGGGTAATITLPLRALRPSEPARE